MGDQAKDAAISGAAQIGSAIVTNAGNKKSQERANKHNIEFWNMQNEYNDPSAQMQRLRKAGLNPNLIYGSNASGASGNAESIAPSKASDYNMPNPLQDINQFADHRQKEATTSNLLEQNTNIAQDTVLKSAQAYETAQRGKLGNTASRLAEATYFNSLQASSEALRKQKAESIGAELDTKFKDQSLKNRLLDIHERVNLLRMQKSGQSLQNDLLRYERELNQLGITKGDPFHYRLIGEPIQEIKDGIKKIQSEDLPKIKNWFNKNFNKK